jgi:hypothetical protein
MRSAAWDAGTGVHSLLMLRREDEKDAFLGNAYALLFPIDWPEPFGLVMIETLACGTPAIAFRPRCQHRLAARSVGRNSSATALRSRARAARRSPSSSQHDKAAGYRRIRPPLSFTTEACESHVYFLKNVAAIAPRIPAPANVSQSRCVFAQSCALHARARRSNTPCAPWSPASSSGDHRLFG